ncbi:MAG: hypothetical protein ABIR50_06210 [Ginsengibacter sp.]
MAFFRDVYLFFGNDISSNDFIRFIQQNNPISHFIVFDDFVAAGLTLTNPNPLSLTQKK